MPRKGRLPEFAQTITKDELMAIRGELAYFIGEMDRLLKLVEERGLSEVHAFSLISGRDRGMPGMRSFISGLNKSYAAIMAGSPIEYGQLTPRSTAKRDRSTKAAVERAAEQAESYLVEEAKQVARKRSAKKPGKRTRGQG